MAKNTAADQPGGPYDDSPVSAYEGRKPPEPARAEERGPKRTPPTGGIPESAATGVGPDADPADEERKREAGGAPEERKRDS